MACVATECDVAASVDSILKDAQKHRTSFTEEWRIRHEQLIDAIRTLHRCAEHPAEALTHPVLPPVDPAEVDHNRRFSAEKESGNASTAHVRFVKGENAGHPSPSSALHDQAVELEKLQRQLQATFQAEKSAEVSSPCLKRRSFSSLSTCATVIRSLSASGSEKGIPSKLHRASSGKLPKATKQTSVPKEKGQASCGHEVQRLSQARIPKAACRGPPASARMSQREPVRVASEPWRETKSVSPTRTPCAPARPRPRCSPCPGPRSPQPVNWLPGRRQVGAPIDLPRQSVRTRLQGRMATAASHRGTAGAWSPEKGGHTFPGLPPEAADVSPDRGTSLSFNPVVNASSTTSTTSHVSPSPVYTPQLVTRSVGQPSTSLSPVMLAPVPGTWAVRPPGLGIALTKAFSTTSLHSNAGPAKKELVRL
mmetsp:Transcript_26202/g.53947  ORF Transcript_26202/g.53947 Transcript_26202/m.53947 type:complete len:423 (+) Transcript_26202:68-1336(+)